MTTTTKQETPNESGALSESRLDNCSQNSSAAMSYASALDKLTAKDLDSLASILKDRATRQRVEIDYDTALAAVENAWLSPMAERSPYAEIIRVRVAVRRLIERSRLHPEQVRGVFLVIANERAPHPMIATASVELGIRDGLANRVANDD
jgi:hypothetical protein